MSHDGAEALRDIILPSFIAGCHVLTHHGLREFLALDLPPRRMILDPWLPEKGLAMIYSPRGTGKTLLAMTSAHSIAMARFPRLQSSDRTPGALYRRRNARPDDARAPCCHCCGLRESAS